MTVEEMERILLQYDSESRSRIYYFLMTLIEGEQDTNSYSEDDFEGQWVRECDRRVERYERGETKSVPWDQVKAEMRSILADDRRIPNGSSLA